eukprot:3106298-Amphidinium_carterae.1
MTPRTKDRQRDTTRKADKKTEALLFVQKGLAAQQGWGPRARLGTKSPTIQRLGRSLHNLTGTEATFPCDDLLPAWRLPMGTRYIKLQVHVARNTKKHEYTQRTHAMAPISYAAEVPKSPQCCPYQSVT